MGTGETKLVLRVEFGIAVGAGEWKSCLGDTKMSPDKVSLGVLQRSVQSFLKLIEAWVIPMSKILKAGGAYFDSSAHHCAFAKDMLHSMLVLWIYCRFFPLRSVPHVYNSDQHIQSLP